MKTSRGQICEAVVLMRVESEAQHPLHQLYCLEPQLHGPGDLCKAGGEQGWGLRVQCVSDSHIIPNSNLRSLGVPSLLILSLFYDKMLALKANYLFL